MKPEIARQLAIRESEITARYNFFGWSDILSDYGDNEELMLEALTKQTLEYPEIVISGLLDAMEVMLDELEE